MPFGARVFISAMSHKNSSERRAAVVRKSFAVLRIPQIHKPYGLVFRKSLLGDAENVNGCL